MMTTLLEFRQVIKTFYAKYDIYVKPVLKFLLALVSFQILNTKMGFMIQLKNPLITVGLSLVCAFLPLNVTVVVGGILMIAHAYALSLETCAVVAGILCVMYLLYFRISSDLAVLLLLTPLCFSLGIPYVIPLLGGLMFGMSSAIPAVSGTLIYYLINYMSQNSTSLGTDKAAEAAGKVASLIDSLINNKEMFLCIAAMVVTILVVYLIRRLSVDYSWELSIAIGAVINVVLHLAGALLPSVSVKIVELLIGSSVSVLITFLIKFFVFSVDYSRTERVQFEDDEYYYYVKAVPKNVIAAPKKTVKKIVSQKKQVKTIKKIES